MSSRAHHASRRIAEVESEFVHARDIVVPALLWLVAIVAVVAIAVFQDEPKGAPAQWASPEGAAVVPFGA